MQENVQFDTFQNAHGDMIQTPIEAVLLFHSAVHEWQDALRTAPESVDKNFKKYAPIEPRNQAQTEAYISIGDIPIRLEYATTPLTHPVGTYWSSVRIFGDESGVGEVSRIFQRYFRETALQNREQILREYASSPAPK